jgi:type II secretory pathway pseudopilin PulG
MRANSLKSSAGFTFVAVLIIVVIMGIMLGAAGQTWQMVMKREREAELLYRGTQIRDAITRWYNPTQTPGTVGTMSAGGPGAKPPPRATTLKPLKDLKYLLKDPTSQATVKYLRQLYKDPFTNKDFVPIFDASQNIIGVASTSEEQPLKLDFSDYPKDSQEFNEFGGKKKYSEWQFAYKTKYGSAPGGAAPPVP